MRSLIKETLLILLFINIFRVTYAPNEADEEKLIDCKRELFAAFKNIIQDEFNPRDIPLENFLYAFLNLNEDSFVGIRRYSKTSCNYYSELLFTILDIDLPSLMTPIEYCRHYHEHYASSSTSCSLRTSVQDCIAVIDSAGCAADADPIVCINNLYLQWQERHISKRFVDGTSGISNEDLSAAYDRGTDNPSSTDDNDLLEEFRNSPGYCPLPEEIVKKEFQRTHGDFTEYYLRMDPRFRNLRSGRVRNSGFNIDRRIPYLREKTYKYFLTHKRKMYDLPIARFRRYGIADVSFKDISAEYNRRRSLAMQFDNFYGRYLHDKIKELNQNDANKFKSVTDYCKDIISKHQYNYWMP